MAHFLPLSAALFATAVSAYPRQPRQAEIQPYVAPGPDDARGPCPMLNTLANHGYINHDGRNLAKQDVFDALLTFVGIEESAVDTAFANAMILCDFITGSDCDGVLGNLTMLALPHAFEHDHSFSRLDYNLSSDGTFDDNKDFNADVFQTSIDVLEGSTHMNFQQMQQIRLQRESLSLEQDVEGWFMESKPIQEFEAGFIFAVMGDFNQDEETYINETQVYVPWWRYWFINESLPYELGWHPPNPPKDVNYILSASSRVLAAAVTSTPSPLPTRALGPADAPVTLPTKVATTTYRLPTNAPYVGPIASASGSGLYRKRQATRTTSASAVEITTWKNPYVELLATSDILSQQHYANRKVAAAAATAK